MNASPRSTGQAKYAWRELDRVEPPKRQPASRVTDFQGTVAPYDLATAREQASRCIQCPNPSCVEVCPLGTPLVDLLALTADGQFREAAQLLFATNSMPELASHTCVGGRLCESECVLDAKAEAVPIRSITRFLLDYGWKNGLAEPPIASATGHNVAVLGSGICGLVAADALSRQGHSVTVIDSRRFPGGRMMNGLPGFRVDMGLVQKRLDLLERRGVKFRMNVVRGQSVQLRELVREFEALYLAFTRSEPVPLAVPGASLNGVFPADVVLKQTTFGRDAGSGQVEVRGRRVVVLGGGDTAMDAIRTAIRCGATSAVCVYRRDAANIAADREEYQNAVEEGGCFRFLTEVVEVLGKPGGHVRAVRCVETRLGERDATGRCSAEIVPGMSVELPADIVLVAYGYQPAKLPAGDFDDLRRDEQGRLVVDADGMTNVCGVFAGGSTVRGPVPLSATVVDARKAAAAMDRFLVRKT